MIHGIRSLPAFIRRLRDSENFAVMSLDEQTVESLRATQYNATVIQRMDVTEDLIRIRVEPDQPLPRFEAGQYVALGLGNWEPRVQPSQQEFVPENRWTKLVRRAYSISCPLLNEHDRLVTCESLRYLEFYVALVRGSDDSDQPAPALTPRMFGLGAGDRIHVANKITGTYTLAGVAPNDTVLMISTGTGEAPHNAMTAQLLSSGHKGAVINVTTARRRADLGYFREHQELMRQYRNYRYLWLTTREPENLDPNHPQYVGKQYIQELFASGKLAELAGNSLSPDHTHVYLCGNPAMIGFVPPGGQPPTQPGMLPLLQAAGFTAEHPGCGHVRFEKYW